MAQYIWEPDPFDAGSAPSNLGYSQPWVGNLGITIDSLVTINGHSSAAGTAIENAGYSHALGLDSTFGGRRLLAIDSINGEPIQTHADQEIYIEAVYLGAAQGNGGLVLRASGSGNLNTGYTTQELRHYEDAPRLGKYLEGEFTNLQPTPIRFTPLEVICTRMRVEGATLSIKSWSKGEAEPAAWMREVTDHDISGPGHIGIFKFSGTPQISRQWALIIGIGTGGDPAPTKEDALPPQGVSTVELIEPRSNRATVTYSYSGGDAAEFQYRLDGLAWGAIEASPAVIGGLDPETAYSVQIRALNAFGEGAASEEYPFTTVAADTLVPGGVLTVVLAAEHNSAVAEYHYNDDDADSFEYRISEVGGAIGEWQIFGPSPHLIDGLAPETEYALDARARNAAGAGATQTLYFETEETPETIEVITDFDTGNVDLNKVVITEEDTDEPIIWLDVRSGLAGWRHATVILQGGIKGKRPVFRLNRATRTVTDTPSQDWRPGYTYNWDDMDAWVRAPGRSLIGGAQGYIEWQFSEPFTEAEVVVSTHPNGRQEDCERYIANLLLEHSDICSPTLSANAQGVFYTTPSESDDISRNVGLQPMFAVKIEFGGSTTDGRPKRKLVMAPHIHGAGEASSWPSFVYAMNWILYGESAEAQAFRANWDVYIYGAVMPNTLFGGSPRLPWRASLDPNRDFKLSGDSTYSEITSLRGAMSADTAGRIDAMLNWHSWGNGTADYGYAWVHTGVGHNNPASDYWLTAAPTVFGVNPHDYNNGGVDSRSSAAWFGQEALGGKLCFSVEIPQNGSTSLAVYKEVGERWVQSIHAVDAQGLFWEPSEEEQPPQYVINILGTTPSPDRVSVAWSYPGEDYTGVYYSIRIDGGGWGNQEDAGTSNPLLITGLASETAYEIRLTPYNEHGAGSPTTASFLTPTHPAMSNEPFVLAWEQDGEWVSCPVYIWTGDEWATVYLDGDAS